TGGTFDVLRTFAQSAAPVMAAGIVGMLLARGRRRLLAVPPLVYAVGSLGTLDQVDAFGRFLLPTLPEFALLAGVALVAVQRRVGPRVLMLPAAGPAGLALLGLGKAPGRLANVRRFADGDARCRHTPPSGAAAW